MTKQKPTEIAKLGYLFESFGVQQRERVRALRTAPVNEAGQYVLYWLRTAMRVHENPALDAAISLANTLRLPLLVHQEFSSRFPFASDRHFAFMLEGARELSREFRKLDICYTVHVERQGQRPSWLHHLAERTAVVVTEEMPVCSMRAWINESLGENDVPVVAVDTACIVPMQLVGQAYDRAYQYRKATQELYNTRITAAFPEMPQVKVLGNPPALPFEPVDFDSESIERLIAACDIDHTVGPISDTIGGSSPGYHRWNDFKSTKLSRYADDRNDALLDATSRMSPYLHYGMVSPFQLAREAATICGHGAEKFLDEMLIWREMAYAFCFYQPDQESFDAIPQWAFETLRAAECDKRQALLSWETLSRVRTGDRLWDAAERSLLMHGELHNNLRMTWGKALLNWTPDARDALAKMIDLNHRYALDGNDPSSYGALLWCLGQFDRGFTPPRPVFGTVRYRGTAEHARRMDVESYWQKATRPISESVPRVAVIGAGISGLMCARTLADHGVPVTVFEKFILDRNGFVVARFGSGTKPDSPEVVSIIETQLAKQAESAEPGTAPGAQEPQELNLADYLWKNRIVIAFAKSQSDAEYQSFRREWDGRREGTSDRDLRLVEVSEKGESRLGDAIIAPASTDKLRNEFEVEPGSTTFVLIGKDGTEKLRKTTFDIDEIFEVIDVMLMRKREMKEKEQG